MRGLKLKNTVGLRLTISSYAPTASRTLNCRAVIDANLRDATCSYCDRTNAVDIAAPVEALIQSIASTVGCYFNAPGDAGVPWDEGAFVIESQSTEDVLLSLSLECHDDLYRDIADAFMNDG
jgi:hypothetical protein